MSNLSGGGSRRANLIAVCDAPASISILQKRAARVEVIRAVAQPPAGPCAGGEPTHGIFSDAFASGVTASLPDF
ncbi:hypothetical protein PMZ80_002694 [Knufia obscura]|uniref:Uncharacterized protein n=2 Tax=Knufia TaxID=430999 RepID=A0AAN8I6D5_9EURO|nr:hypothetical protein PMZ80_002694 [Knufia obscura]KAK5951470.1 hypothetical protein OHC33_007526 [Knufia fluminis]